MLQEHTVILVIKTAHLHVHSLQVRQEDLQEVIVADIVAAEIVAVEEVDRQAVAEEDKKFKQKYSKLM
jgi:hypothetical protein